MRDGCGLFVLQYSSVNFQIEMDSSKVMQELDLDEDGFGRQSARMGSGMPSAWDQTENEELMDLLNTNTILIENKRHIYETKIQSYHSKMIKMQKLIKTARQQDEKQELYQKYLIFEQKHREASIKLQRIASIEIELMEAHCRGEEMPSQPVDSRKDSEWRIKSYKSHSQQRINRSSSSNVGKGHQAQRFNQTCSIFNESRNSSPLKQLDIQSASGPKAYSIYNQLMTGDKVTRVQRLLSQDDLQSNENQPFLNKKENKKLQPDYQQQISNAMELLAQIYSLQGKTFKKDISKNQTGFYLLLEKSLLQIKDGIMNKNQQLRTAKNDLKKKAATENTQKLAAEKQKMKLQQINQQLNECNQELASKQRELLQSIDQLEDIQTNTLGTLINNLEQTCQSLGIDVSNMIVANEQSGKIIGLYDAINKNILNQKMTAMDRKESLLSLQYKLDLLKGEEINQKGRIEKLQDELLQQQQRKKLLEKQNKKLSKENESLNQQTERLSVEAAELEDLSGIRQSSYSELESKYSKLKSKKVKLEESVKNLQSQEKQLKQSTSRVGQLLDRNEKYLNKINEQIRARRVEREELASKLERIDGEISQKEDQLKQTQTQLNRRQQILKKLEKRISQTQQKVAKEEKKIEMLQQQRKELACNIEKQEKYLGQTLPKEIKEIKSAKREMKELISSLQVKITESQEKLAQLTSQTKQKQSCLQKIILEIQEASHREKQLYRENQQLSCAKQEQEKIIAELSDKRQQLESRLSQIEGQITKNQYQLVKLEQQLKGFDEETCKRKDNLKKLEQDLRIKSTQLNEINIKINVCSEDLQKIVDATIDYQEEQLNIQSRLKQLKKVQRRIVLEVALKRYEELQWAQEMGQKCLKQALNSDIKFEVEEMVEQIAAAKDLKQLYNKEKQINRKLKLQNEQMRKLCEMEENSFQV